MCGTNPAFQILKTWIEERKLEGEDASGVFATLPAHLQTPGPDIVRQFYVSMSAASSGTHTDAQTPTALFGAATQGEGETRQAMYVKRNIVVLSCNQFNRGKAIRITYSGYVLVALGIQYAVCMRHIVCRLYNIFPHYLIKDTIFEKKIEFKMCFDIFYNF